MQEGPLEGLVPTLWSHAVDQLAYREGLGRLMVDSVLARDYPVVQGCLLFTAVIYVLVNLAVDLLYPLFDPRVTAS